MMRRQIAVSTICGQIVVGEFAALLFLGVTISSPQGYLRSPGVCLSTSEVLSA